MSWFAGASVGYLTELEEPMYNVHVGVTNSCWMLGGWNVGTFIEVGYTQKDESYNTDNGGEMTRPDQGANFDFDVDEMGDFLSLVSDEFDQRTSYDLDIIPITLNVKFERALSGNLNAYLGAGVGMALVNLDMNVGEDPGDSLSDSDWVLTTQIFGGLSYNVTPAFTVYGGARWTYMDDANVSDGGYSGTLELGSDCLLELGARYKF
jgi:opacity protein-like surface antigen